MAPAHPAPVELGAILTGGRGSRMGADKLQLTLDERPLPAWVYRRIAPLVGAVVGVGRDLQLPGVVVPTVPDRFPGAGSLGGLATALGYAWERFGVDAWVLCVACDMPFLEPALLELLAERRSGGSDVVMPRTGVGYEPLCALYRAGAAQTLVRSVLAGERRIRAALQGLPVVFVEEGDLRAADPLLRSFWNVNRPADLERARAYLAATGAEPCPTTCAGCRSGIGA